MPNRDIAVVRDQERPRC